MKIFFLCKTFVRKLSCVNKKYSFLGLYFCKHFLKIIECFIVVFYNGKNNMRRKCIENKKSRICSKQRNYVASRAFTSRFSFDSLCPASIKHTEKKIQYYPGQGYVREDAKRYSAYWGQVGYLFIPFNLNIAAN